MVLWVEGGFGVAGMTTFLRTMFASRMRMGYCDSWSRMWQRRLFIHVRC